MDPTMYTLLTDAQYAVPQVLPDGPKKKRPRGMRGRFCFR